MVRRLYERSHIFPKVSSLATLPSTLGSFGSVRRVQWLAAALRVDSPETPDHLETKSEILNQERLSQQTDSFREPTFRVLNLVYE